MTLLVPIRPEVFAQVVESSIAKFAEDQVAGGCWPRADALERSRGDFRCLLPQGLATPDKHWFEIRASENGPPVGHLWFAVQSEQGQRNAFVYNLEIHPASRRQGHARRALEALHGLTEEMGLARVGLHVFAFNAPARALYRALGYKVTSLNMSKPLQTAGTAA